MDTNDFLGSYAQENVSFTTQVIKSTSVGDNYWKLMIFIEDSQFVDVSVDGWELFPGSETVRGLTVTSDDYTTYTSGLLQSWLYDLFVNGFSGDCILVAIGSTYSDDTLDEDTTVTNLETAYELAKAYAYFKTVCIVDSTDANALNTTVADKLAELCANDYTLLSSLPLYPYTTATPSDPTTDTLYNAVVTTGGHNAFFSAHQDDSRNGAIYSLGLALAVLNNSGTYVGNQFEMIASSNITCSGADGTNLSKAVRATLQDLYIQTFKPVGDNSGDVAALGGQYTNGDYVAAQWIICYVGYMVKVDIAQMMTTRGFLKNSVNYDRILLTLQNRLETVGSSGRLTNILITAPAYADLPETDSDTITISGAWQATFVTLIRQVDIIGTLYIGE